jgi:hypothetical protein
MLAIRRSGMRKVLGIVVIGLVGCGAILWLLEPYKNQFPEDLEAVFELVWAPIPLPRVVIAIATLAIGFLLLEYSANVEGKKMQEAAKAKGLAKLEPSFDTLSDQRMDRMSLTDDEESVLSTLTRFANSVNAYKLRQNTGLNELRFEQALGNLRSRSFIDDVALNEGRSISFKQDGRRYAVKHKLDKK